MKTDKKKRCFGDKEGDHMADYHDIEWGTPSHDDQHLFEMLVLEGAQAGLSWDTVLKKRNGYRRAFHNFDPRKVAAMTDGDLAKVCEDPSVIRNNLKVKSARQNARVFLEIQKEFGSFDKYIWGFVNGKPIENERSNFKDLPSKTSLSDKVSKDLKKRGMSFVGSTIMYSYMQAVGMVNDHLEGCWKKVK